MLEFQTIHGSASIEGRTHFRLNAEAFIISPLQSNADLHIVSIDDEVNTEQYDDKVIDTVAAGDYCKVDGLVKFIELYIDTDETFFIKW